MGRGHSFVVGMILWLWLSCQPAATAAAGPATPTVAPIPEWVVSEPAVTELRPGTKEEGITRRLLLVDEQIHAGRREVFVRRVHEVLNEQGVSDGSTLAASFDPTYQTLVLHTAAIWRGEQRLERLDPAKLRLLQQEEEADRHLYHGEHEARLLLDDVRVGDRVEFAFTITGRNPVLRDRFASSFFVGSSLPVLKRRHRLIWPGPSPLAWLAHGPAPAPTVRTTAEGTEYWWEEQDGRPVEFEYGAPGWHPQFPWVQLSDFRSWSEVVEWALPLYPADQPLPDEVARRVTEWSGAATAEGKIRGALQFVQDDIRYLGIEVGPGSHEPSAPALVCERRFGDCKDKSLLLVTLLRRLGINAWPLLVDTQSRASLTNWLPSPFAFNHVVVLARADGHEWVLDGTLQFQRGPLASRHVPAYGAGLLVAPGQTQLTRLPMRARGLDTTDIREHFKVGKVSEPSELTVVTVARGLDAENLRESFAVNSRDSLGKSYLNYYDRTYPGIELHKPIQLEDDPEANVVTVREYYRIPELWRRDGEGEDKRMVAKFFPTVITDLALAPDGSSRKTPLALRFPRRVTVKTTADLPEEWTWAAKRLELAGPANRLSVVRQPGGKQAVFQFTYETTAPEVSPADFRRHGNVLRQMEEAIGYQLTWNPELAAGGGWAGMNWTLVLLGVVFALLLLVLGVAVVVLAFRRRRPPALPTGAGAAVSPVGRPQGVGGWLILVAIQVCLSPVMLLFGTFHNPETFQAAVWHNLTTPGSESYHVLWAPILVFELFTNLSLLAASLVLIPLFFQEHRWFRWGYFAFLIARMILLGLDFALGSQIPAVQASLGQKDYKELGQAIMAALIWGSYVLVSVRVRNTFVR